MKKSRVKVYNNHDLVETWKRISRHDWEHKHQYQSQITSRLLNNRVRRLGLLPPVLCNGSDCCCES